MAKTEQSRVGFFKIKFLQKEKWQLVSDKTPVVLKSRVLVAVRFGRAGSRLGRAHHRFRRRRLEGGDVRTRKEAESATSAVGRLAILFENRK